MWNLREAWGLITKLQPVALARGYTLALFGSTLLKGIGRDCDLVAFPFRPDAVTAFDLMLSLRGESAEPFRQSPRVFVRDAQAFQYLVNGKLVDILILAR